MVESFVSQNMTKILLLQLIRLNKDENVILLYSIGNSYYNINCLYIFLSGIKHIFCNTHLVDIMAAIDESISRFYLFVIEFFY